MKLRFDLSPIFAYLPLVSLMLFYLATTVAGATVMLLPGGKEALHEFLGYLDPTVAQDIGNSTYLILLIAPLVLAPIFALAGIRITRSVLAMVPPRTLKNIKCPVAALWLMTAAAIAYCLLKLGQAGALYPAILLERRDYNAQMLERARLMGEMRFIFYAVVYAVIPTLSALFFARFLHRRNWGDLAGFAVTWMFFTYLVVVIYLKAPFLVFFILLATVVVVSRASLLYIPALLVLAVGTFLSMQVMIGGTPPEAAEVRSAAAPAQKPAAAPTPKPKPAGVPAPKPTASPKPAAVPESVPKTTYMSALQATASSLVFRMSSTFPFYVSVFEDPAERCGIEANRLPFLEPPSCVMPTKVFTRMYPSVHWITGFAPASAHVSAYGEVGLGYAVLIMCLSGFSVGVLGALSTAGGGPLFVVLNAASCVFAYYLTQVPFIGALTYSHGLIFYLAPLVVLFAVGLLRGPYSKQAQRSTTDLYRRPG